MLPPGVVISGFSFRSLVTPQEEKSDIWPAPTLSSVETALEMVMVPVFFPARKSPSALEMNTAGMVTSVFSAMLDREPSVWSATMRPMAPASWARSTVSVKVWPRRTTTNLPSMPLLTAYWSNSSAVPVSMVLPSVRMANSLSTDSWPSGISFRMLRLSAVALLVKAILRSPTHRN